jgi:hypothetical protein
MSIEASALHNRILLKLSTEKNGICLERLIISLMRENPKIRFSYEQFEEMLIFMEKDRRLLLGDNRRYYLY